MCLPFFVSCTWEKALSSKLRISLDAMGGDDAPAMVVAGAARVHKVHKHLSFIFAGDETSIQAELDKHKALAAVSSIIHTEDTVPNDMKPGVALRQGRKSSMRLAINTVAEGEADVVLSAGNTGALMAMAKFALKTLPGVTRPAIASVFPTMTQTGTVVLDLGANIECSARNLVEFAVLGSVYARYICHKDQPKVALLNVGSEDMKGHDHIREAADILSNSLSIGSYAGFAEGTDLNKGEFDVIVADGFTGNVALKTSEGTAKLIAQMMKESIGSSPLSYLGYPFMLPALKKLKARIDPRLYNGGMFMGLRGLCVKSHGGTDEIGFANAIKVAHDLAQHKFNGRVAEVLNDMQLDALFDVKEDS